jgi:hypothetical protein
MTVPYSPSATWGQRIQRLSVHGVRTLRILVTEGPTPQQDLNSQGLLELVSEGIAFVKDGLWQVEAGCSKVASHELLNLPP